MSIPQAVLRQAERSDALLKAHFNPQAEAPPVVAAPAPEASPPPADPPASAPVEAVVPAVAEPAEKRVDWKQKYLVLEGKYRAEVPRYAADLRDSRQKIQDLTDKNLSLHEDNDRLRKGKPAASSTDLTDDANFDPAIIATIGERARKAADAAVSARLAPFEDRAAETERATASTARANFESDVNDYLLDSHKVGWREIDTKPEFHAYLAEREPQSGVVRQLLLNDAIKHGDSLRAVAFFQDFLNKTTKPVKPAPVVPAVDPRAHLATPAAASAGAAVTQQEKRKYSRQDVKDFYDIYAKASVNPATTKADFAEMKAIDLDIQHAMREGRIT